PNMPSLKHRYHLLSNPQASSQRNQSQDPDHLGGMNFESSSLEIPLALTKRKKEKRPVTGQSTS
ncbi:hypothetical protein PIB30_111354, partial [Stylosanthes scabra]|nr:hypothetical protein [Stylosanthes scabra]